MKRILSIVLVLMLLVTVAGCGTAKQDSIKMMLFTSLTGDMAAAGEMDTKGAELAVKHINDEGGLLGKKVELVVVDATSDPTQAPLILENALKNGGISCVIGSHSSAIFSTQQEILERYEVPAMADPQRMNLTTQGYTFFFRGGTNGEDLGQANLGVLQYLVELSGKTIADFNVGIVYENSSYGVDTAGEYSAWCEELGFNVPVNETWPAGQLTDASSLVTKLKQNNVDVVLSVAYPSDTKLILNTMESMTYSPIIVGGGAGFIWPTLEEEMGEDVNGIISSAGWNWDSTCNYEIDGWQKIVDEYVKTYGVFMAEQAGQTYSHIRIFADAITLAKSSDPVKVRDAVLEMNADSCKWMKLMAPGTGAFDAAGNWPDAVGTVIQWQNGVPTTVWPLDIAKSEILH